LTGGGRGLGAGAQQGGGFLGWAGGVKDPWAVTDGGWLSGGGTVRKKRKPTAGGEGAWGAQPTRGSPNRLVCDLGLVCPPKKPRNPAGGGGDPSFSSAGGFPKQSPGVGPTICGVNSKYGPLLEGHGGAA